MTEAEQQIERGRVLEEYVDTGRRLADLNLKRKGMDASRRELCRQSDALETRRSELLGRLEGFGLHIGESGEAGPESPPEQPELFRRILNLLDHPEDREVQGIMLLLEAYEDRQKDKAPR